jgi:hypothetical protein
VDGATAAKLAAGANFIQTNQQVAFNVSSGYYKLLTAQERLQAAQETLKTAQTTQDAAENQLANGRSTLPDVLNARAETAQATFDLESADGEIFARQRRSTGRRFLCRVQGRIRRSGQRQTLGSLAQQTRLRGRQRWRFSGRSLMEARERMTWRLRSRGSVQLRMS